LGWTDKDQGGQEIRKILRILSVMVILPLAAALFTVNAVSASGAVSVSVNTPGEVNKDDFFMVTVDISEVLSLNAVQYDVSFDPSLLRLEKIDEGQMDTGAIVQVMYNEISPGTFRVISSMGLDTVDGSGCLSVLQFHALKAGTSTMNLSNGIVSGINGEIPATWTGNSVDVTSAEPGEQATTPAPSSSSEQTPVESQPDTVDEETPVKPEPETVDEETPAESEPEASVEELGAIVTTTSAGSEAPDTGDDKPASQPVSSEKEIKWPVLGGIIGGVAVIIGLIIYARINRRIFIR
jgi:hypothetical protein